MPLSGSFTGKSSNQYVQPKITWSATQSISGNYSDVTATLTYSRTNTGYTTYGWYEGGITIDGTRTAVSKTISITYNSNTVAVSATKRVYHNTDGSKSIAISGDGAIHTDVLGYTDISATITLDKIPRKATITSAPDFNDEQNPTFYFSNPAGNAVSKLEVCISSDGYSIEVPYREVSKTATSYTFNLTDTERVALRKAVKKANAILVYFYVRTTIGSEVYLDNVSRTFSLISYTPKINPVVYDSNSTTVALTGDSSKLVKYFSNAYYAINAAARKEATISSQKVENNGVNYNGASGTINNIESGIFTFSATDSRGFSAAQVISLNVVSYIKPTIQLECIPTLNTDNTLTIRATAKGKVFNGSFGATNNSITVSYRIKEDGGSYGSWNNKATSHSGYDYTAAAMSFTGLNYQKVYVVETRITDSLHTSGITLEQTVSAKPIFDWGKDDFQFNVPVTFNEGIDLDPADIGAVPDTRTINGKRLNSNISLSAGDIGAYPSTGGTVSGHVHTSLSGESQVGCNFNGGMVYLFGNNSTGNHGLYDSVKGYIINLNSTTPQFNGNATSASTATDNGNWVLLSQRSIGANASVTFTDSHNCTSYIVWILQSGTWWETVSWPAGYLGTRNGYYSNGSYYEHILSKSGTTLTLTNYNTIDETYIVYGIR